MLFFYVSLSRNRSAVLLKEGKVQVVKQALQLLLCHVYPAMPYEVEDGVLVLLFVEGGIA